MILGQILSALGTARLVSCVSREILVHPDGRIQPAKQIGQYLAEAGTPIFIVDLRRPASNEDVEMLLQEFNKSAPPPVLLQDFDNSLRAAFSIEEVAAQLKQANVNGLSVKELGDQHLLIEGVRR